MPLEAFFGPKTVHVFRNCSLLDELLLNMPKWKEKKKFLCHEDDISMWHSGSAKILEKLVEELLQILANAATSNA